MQPQLHRSPDVMSTTSNRYPLSFDNKDRVVATSRVRNRSIRAPKSIDTIVSKSANTSATTELTDVPSTDSLERSEMPSSCISLVWTCHSPMSTSLKTRIMASSITQPQSRFCSCTAYWRVAYSRSPSAREDDELTISERTIAVRRPCWRSHTRERRTRSPIRVQPP